MALTAPRQEGKTEIGVKLIEDFAFSFNKRANPKALVLMSTCKQSEKIYFNRLNEFLSGLPDSFYKVSGTSMTHLTVRIFRPEFDDYATIMFAGIVNSKALLGGTYDFMILDEAEQYPVSVWTKHLRPMIKATDGKILVTSTREWGGWFYGLVYTYIELNKGGDPKVYGINVMPEDIEDFDSEGNLPSIYEEYKALDKLEDFFSQYMNDPRPRPSPHAPYVELTGKLRFIEMNDIINYCDFRAINVSIDVGHIGSYAVWYWVRHRLTRKPIVFGYQDGFANNQDMVIKVNSLFKDKEQINLLFPFDIAQASSEFGSTRYANVQSYIRDVGLDRRIRTNVLSKTKDKLKLHGEGINKFGDITFISNISTKRGVRKLEDVRFHKSKVDGIVTFGKVVANGSEHCLDAYLYIHSAVNENIDSQFEERYNIKNNYNIDYTYD